MADIATISTLLTSIKTATEISKALRQVDVSLDKAEMKLKLADLMESLADAKIRAAEIQDELAEKDQRIIELEKALETKARVVRHGDAYYEMDASGNPSGDPYCSHCWEAYYRLIHIHEATSLHSSCSVCRTSFRRGRVPSLKKRPIESTHETRELNREGS